MIDQEQLAASSPEDVAAYLQLHGWTEVYRDAGGTAWASEDVESLSGPELWVPRTRQMRGYLNRIASLLDALADHEQRSQAEILFEIVFSLQDVQRFRSLPSTESGTMPLQDSTETLAGIHKWVQAGAGATAVAELGPILPSRHPVSVENFMGQVKLAAPSPGSFVWKVTVPVASADGSQMIPFSDVVSFPELASFNRRVTRRLYDATAAALNACRLVRQGEPVLESFQQVVAEGVTANLCEGLAGAGGERNIPFDLTFSWASSLPSPRTDRLSFGGTEIGIVRRAAEEFRRVAPELDVRLRGYIVRLSRDSEQRPGVVTLAGTAVGDTEQKFGHFTFELVDDDYSDALRSHAEHQIVTVRGDVVRRGNRRHLENVRDFRIAAEELDT
ncbi:MAG: hypothetical protein AB7L91_14595 [Dehalococcoidia bacterium]